MTLVKKDIAKLVSKKINVNEFNANKLLDFFLSNIKSNLKEKTIKINNFGSFQYKETPARMGRNPKTKTEFKINSFKRLIFKTSFRLKKYIN